ncbi:uncharacterized protein V1510DRAFT_361228 [Dipodascopsis tothii]|uniref:uncharacterized protein n=1 Tax=Dipodascopsis tothii TaxID=44089 RepID=UPI0034CF54CA
MAPPRSNTRAKRAAAAAAGPDKRARTAQEGPPDPPPAGAPDASADAPADAPDALPPLPGRFLDLYTAAPRVGDDPALHGGRERVLAHVDGLWPTHAYVDWRPSADDADALEAVVETVGAPHSLVRSSVGVPLPLHVSLSDTLQLQAADRDAFVGDVRAALAELESPPPLALDGAVWVANSTRTRFFLALTVDAAGREALAPVLAAVNTAAARRGLAQLSGRFHVSIGWTLDEPDEAAVAGVADSVASLGLAVAVGAVKVRVGQTVHSLALGGL